MKKHNYVLIALMVSVILFLCACAREGTELVSSVPASDTSSISTSVPPSSSAPPTTTVPTTTETALPVQLSTDWVTDREVIPFEDRFNEDASFGSTYTAWLVPEVNGYRRYYLTQNNSHWPAIVKEGAEDGEVVYEIPVQRDLSDFNVIAADGRWGYLGSDGSLIKVDLLTGESTTLAEKNGDDIRWEVQACGKDTVCIFQLDAERNLRIYYRDLHSDAEKTLYEGVLPQSSPYDLKSEMRGLYFSAPRSTLGTFSWEMMNPAFYAAVQKELENPESPFQHHYQENYYSNCWKDPETHPIHLATYPNLCEAIQDAYNSPYYVEYICDPVSGIVTEDYGIVDSCFYGTGQGHNHFDYEITKEETPEILNVAPVEIPNFIKLTEAQAVAAVALNKEFHYRSYYKYRYSEFGHYLPYMKQDGIYIQLADIPVANMVATPDFAYCITTENTIIQLSLDGQICNTVYTSDNKLDNLFYWQGRLYFTDNKTVICINTITGTWCPILRTTLKELYIIGEYMDGLYFGIRQGLYCQEYRFYPDTGDLVEESYI